MWLVKEILTISVLLIIGLTSLYFVYDYFKSKDTKKEKRGHLILRSVLLTSIIGCAFTFFGFNLMNKLVFHTEKVVTESVVVNKEEDGPRRHNLYFITLEDGTRINVSSREYRDIEVNRAYRFTYAAGVDDLISYVDLD